MRFDDTETDALWRTEVRTFLVEHMTPELKAELKVTNGRHGGPHELAFRRAVIERGWYGLNWSAEYGGLAKSAVQQLILIDEFDYAGAPPLPTTVTSVAPTLIAYGSAQNRQQLLPGMSDGTYNFALGYSEPEAGTDLASMRTRAVRDGSEWIINGEKVWCSYAHFCSHFWLAVRTGAKDSRHHGISLLVVPRDIDGITVRPLWTWSGVRTNQVILDDVRVPLDNLIGEENHGWEYIRAALSFERVAMGVSGRLRRIRDNLVRAAGDHETEGEPLVSHPPFVSRLVEIDLKLEVARLMSLRTAQAIDSGRVPIVEGSMQKVFVTELQTELAAWGMESFGLHGQLDKADPDAPADGELEWAYREAPFLRFGGGTNEIQRSIIAQRALGLPR